MKAIIWKELRQHRAWVVIGWLVIGIFAYLAAPKGLNDFHNNAYYSSAVSMVGLGAAALALALGFVQSFWDYGDRQSDYLRHRAVSEQDIWIGKVVAGSILFAAAVVVPLLVLTFYLARVGPNSLPTRPIQVVPVALLASLCFFFQPAMMLSIRRPAAWLGSRFFPIAPVAVVCGVYAFLAGNTLTAWVVWLVCLAVLTASAWLGRKPYVVHAAIVIASAATAAVFAVVAITWSQSGVPPDQPFAYGVDSSNRPWAVQLDYESTGHGLGGERYRSAVLLQEPSTGSSPTSPPDDLTVNPAGWRTTVTDASDVHDPGRVEHFGIAVWHAFYYDHAGYFLFYNSFHPRRLIAYVGRDGFYPQPPPAQARFPRKPSLQPLDGYPLTTLLSDQDGIYQVDTAARTIRKLLGGPIDGIYPLDFFMPQTLQYVINRGGQWSWYEFIAEDTNAQRDSAKSSAVQPALRAIRLRDLPPPPLTPSETQQASIAASPAGDLTIFMLPSSGQRRLISYDGSEGSWQSRVVADTPSISGQSGSELLAGALFPPVLPVGGAAAAIMHEYRQNGRLLEMSPQDRREMITLGIGMLAIVLISCIAVAYLRGRYRLTWRQMMCWMASTMFLGLAAPLAMVAIHSRPVLEDCPSCRRHRRVDEEHCEYCGAAWPEAQREGIELFEHARPILPSPPPREEYATSES